MSCRRGCASCATCCRKRTASRNRSARKRKKRTATIRTSVCNLNPNLNRSRKRITRSRKTTSCSHPTRCMNCATHQQTPAVAYCRTCGKPLCENCKREVHGLIYCEDCIASRVHGAPAGAGVVNPQAPHPGVALVLGMIPGVGAMYCGEFMRAFIHVAVFAGLIAATSEVHWIFGPMIGFWWFYMLFDSYQIAKAKQEGRPVQDVFGFMTSSGFGRSNATSATAPTEPAPATPPLIDVNRSQNMPLGPIVL